MQVIPKTALLPGYMEQQWSDRENSG